MATPKPIFFGMSGEDRNILSPDKDVTVTTTVEVDDEIDEELLEEDTIEVDETDDATMMYDKVHQYLDVLETVEQAGRVLTKHGCTQVTSELLSLSDITSGLRIREYLPSLESLPTFIDTPEYDDTTQTLLSKLDDRVSNLSINSGNEFFGDELSQSMLAYLDPRVRYVRNNAKIVLSQKISEARAKTYAVRLPDYKKVHDYIPKAIECIKKDDTFRRHKKLEELHDLFANLDDRVEEYNKLAREYVNWFRDTFDAKSVPSNMFSLASENWSRFREYQVRKKEMFSNRYKDILWDTEWFKNKTKVINDGLQCCTVMHYSKTHMLRTGFFAGNSFTGKLRPNRLKTALDRRFDISLSTLLRLAAIDHEWYRFNAKLVNLYIHWGVIRLMYALNKCAASPVDLGAIPKLHAPKKKK